MPKHQWTTVSKILHAFIGICVVIQLVTLMLKWYIPLNNSWYAYRSNIFTVHIYDGLIFFWVALAFFLYKLFVQASPSAKRLYPYFSKDMRWVMQDIQTLCGLRLPVREGGGLAGLIQGLGVLLVLGLGLTGSLAYLTWHDLVSLPLSGKQLIGFHKDLGNILYWYLAGHVGMSVVHRITPKRFWESYGQ